MANLAGRTTYLPEKESRGPSLQKTSKCLGGNSSKFRPSSGLLRSVHVLLLIEEMLQLFIGTLSPLITGSFIDPRVVRRRISSIFLCIQETVQLQLFDEALALRADET